MTSSPKASSLRFARMALNDSRAPVSGFLTWHQRNRYKEVRNEVFELKALTLPPLISSGDSRQLEDLANKADPGVKEVQGIQASDGL